MIILLFSCIRFHDIGKLKDFSSQDERVTHAYQAAKWSSKSFQIQEEQKQAFAAQVVGQLRVAEPELIEQMLLTASSSTSSAVRKQAYWALGELGRELDWNESSQAIHIFLLQKLLEDPSDIEAQLITEAIIKNYVPHTHTIDEDVQTLMNIHSYLAEHPNPSTPIFILKQQLQTLPVLTAVLHKQMDAGNELEIYTSALELMRFLSTNQLQLHQAHHQYKDSLSDAFGLTVKILQQSSTSQSMLLWFLSTVAERPPLSSYIVNELVLLEQDLSPSNRFLLQEALFQMLEEESARTYFRENFLLSETNLSWWHDSVTTELDLIQQLYGIKVRSE